MGFIWISLFCSHLKCSSSLSGFKGFSLSLFYSVPFEFIIRTDAQEIEFVLFCVFPLKKKSHVSFPHYVILQFTIATAQSCSHWAGWRRGNPLDPHSGGYPFELCSGHWLFPLMTVIVFLSLSTQMPTSIRTQLFPSKFLPIYNSLPLFHPALGPYSVEW
jgi:hypothetical protein